MFTLETSEIHHRFAQHDVLRGVDMQVPTGSIYGFLGPNGAGKTTTLRLILGLLKTQRGEIRIFGKRFNTRFDKDRIAILANVGSMIESPSLYDHLTAAENLRLLQIIHQCPESRIGEVLELVGLADTGKKRAKQFSLGMRQRLAIAAALLHRPSLIILDEPTNGLDPSGIIEIRNLLVELNQRHGCTILVWRSCWESMAIFLLPLGAIMATSLITQIEFKGNAWKQIHTLPVSTAVIFLSKLAVILVLLIVSLLLFNAGIYVSAMIPSVLVPGVPYPKGSFLSLPLLQENSLYFVYCLPIVAAQYLMALRSNNVLVPIGIGFMAWVGALAAVSSKLAVWWPYSYTIIQYLRDKPKGTQFAAHYELPWLAVSAFVLLTVVSYGMFITKNQRG